MKITINQVVTVAFCVAIFMFAIGFYLGSIYETGNLQQQLKENPEIICGYTNSTSVICPLIITNSILGYDILG